MTFAAMAEPVHEIGPTIDLGALLRIWREGFAIHIEQLPKPDRSPDIVGEGQLVRGHRVFHCRQGIEIRLEVDEVLIGHALIGCVRERGIEVHAARSDSPLHGVDEVERAPIADAGLLVFPCAAAPAALALASLIFMASVLKSSNFSQISGLASLRSSLLGI